MPIEIGRIRLNVERPRYRPEGKLRVGEHGVRVRIDDVDRGLCVRRGTEHVDVVGRRVPLHVRHGTRHHDRRERSQRAIGRHGDRIDLRRVRRDIDERLWEQVSIRPAELTPVDEIEAGGHTGRRDMLDDLEVRSVDEEHALVGSGGDADPRVSAQPRDASDHRNLHRGEDRAVPGIEQEDLAVRRGRHETAGANRPEPTDRHTDVAERVNRHPTRVVRGEIGPGDPRDVAVIRRDEEEVAVFERHRGRAGERDGERGADVAVRQDPDVRPGCCDHPVTRRRLRCGPSWLEGHIEGSGRDAPAEPGHPVVAEQCDAPSNHVFRYVRVGPLEGIGRDPVLPVLEELLRRGRVIELVEVRGGRFVQAPRPKREQTDEEDDENDEVTAIEPSATLVRKLVGSIVGSVPTGKSPREHGTDGREDAPDDPAERSHGPRQT